MKVSRCVFTGPGSEGEVWAVWCNSQGSVAKRAPGELLRAGRTEGYAAEELLRGYRRLRRCYWLPPTGSLLVHLLFRCARADDVTGRAARAPRREPAGLAASPGCCRALLTPPSSREGVRARARARASPGRPPCSGGLVSLCGPMCAPRAGPPPPALAGWTRSRRNPQVRTPRRRIELGPRRDRRTHDVQRGESRRACPGRALSRRRRHWAADPRERDGPVQGGTRRIPGGSGGSL